MDEQAPERPTRRARRLAARAEARVDARGPRTGEIAVTDAARAAREAAGLPAEPSDTARWRWLQREEERARATPPHPPSGGRHRAPE
ncbi:hypothetical protein [Geodermatophilus sp. SYSU D01119]